LKQQIKECVEHFSSLSIGLLKEYTPEFYAEPRKIIKIDYAKNRTVHRGGLYSQGPGINLAGRGIEQYISSHKLVGLVYFQEYASFSKDPIIGSAYMYKWETYVGLIVAHEIAHAAQRYTEFVRLLDRTEPHGHHFKSIYKVLRSHINKELPDQVVAKQKYTKVLQEAKRIEYGKN
jgi:hypothetical protein